MRVPSCDDLAFREGTYRRVETGGVCRARDATFLPTENVWNFYIAPHPPTSKGSFSVPLLPWCSSIHSVRGGLVCLLFVPQAIRSHRRHGHIPTVASCARTKRSSLVCRLDR